MMYAANVAEGDLANGNAYVEKVREYAKDFGAEVIIVSAQVESELSEMEE